MSKASIPVPDSSPDASPAVPEAAVVAPAAVAADNVKRMRTLINLAQAFEDEFQKNQVSERNDRCVEYYQRAWDLHTAGTAFPEGDEPVIRYSAASKLHAHYATVGDERAAYFLAEKQALLENPSVKLIDLGRQATGQLARAKRLPDPEDAVAAIEIAQGYYREAHDITLGRFPDDPDTWRPVVNCSYVPLLKFDEYLKKCSGDHAALTRLGTFLDEGWENLQRDKEWLLSRVETPVAGHIAEMDAGSTIVGTLLTFRENANKLIHHQTGRGRRAEFTLTPEERVKHLKNTIHYLEATRDFLSAVGRSGKQVIYNSDAEGRLVALPIDLLSFTTYRNAAQARQEIATIETMQEAVKAADLAKNALETEEAEQARQQQALAAKSREALAALSAPRRVSGTGAGEEGAATSPAVEIDGVVEAIALPPYQRLQERVAQLRAEGVATKEITKIYSQAFEKAKGCGDIFTKAVCAIGLSDLSTQAALDNIHQGTYLVAVGLLDTTLQYQRQALGWSKEAKPSPGCDVAMLSEVVALVIEATQERISKLKESMEKKQERLEASRVEAREAMGEERWKSNISTTISERAEQFQAHRDALPGIAKAETDALALRRAARTASPIVSHVVSDGQVKVAARGRC